MSNSEFYSAAPKAPKAVKRNGLLSFFRGTGAGNRIARLQFRALMLVLIIFGSLCYILPPETGITLLAISLAVTCLVTIGSTAKRLNKLEDELKTVDTKPECRVEGRSADLKKSEESYRSILQNASDAIYLTDNTGRLIDMSKSACRMLGYSKEELLQFKFSDIVDPESLKELPIELPSIPNQPIFKERTLITKDGRKIYVEINGQRIDQDRLMGVARDITERKRIEADGKKTEAELKISEQKYKLLFENNPLPLWIVAKDDLTVIAANDASAKLYGYSREELQGMDIKQLRPQAHWGKLVASYRADISEATGFGVIEHVKKDGTEIMVEIIAQDIVYEGRLARLSSTHDVTEKLRAETLLKASEANLQTILNNTDTAYALLNAGLDIVEYNNKAQIFVQNEFNFELSGAGKVYDSMPEERKLQFIAYTRQVFAGQAVSYEISYPQVEGSASWYYVRMSPIADTGGQILGLVLAITDITARKAAEQSIRAHLEKIREMNWNQSHLIRSPLANLKGLFPMIKADPADQAALDFAEAELERMDQILKNEIYPQV